MKIIIKYIVLVGIFLSCAKDDRDTEDVLKGNSHISGHVTFKDLYAGISEKKPAADRRVYISYSPTDSINFIYYVKTDSQGYFSFTRLDRDTKYDLFIIDSSDKIKYSAFVTVQTPNDSVEIVATNDTIKQNSVLVHLTDGNGHYVPNATVGIYNNGIIFGSDTSITQAFAHTTTDPYGRALFYNLKAGLYFLRAKINYQDNKLIGNDTIDFGGKGIREYALEMKVSPAPVEDTLTIKTMDEQGGVLPNISFCLFSNPQLFNSNECNGSVFNNTTNTSGNHTIYNLPAGTYYALAQGNIQNLLYKGTLTFNWDGVSIKTETIILQKVLPNNLLLLDINDTTGSPVNGTNLYLFTSRVLFLADTTSASHGYVHDTTTNAFGRGVFQNLEVGKYFIRAKAHYGSTLLMGGDTVTISGAGNFTRPPIRIKQGK